jgi:outer membrane protein TolC
MNDARVREAIRYERVAEDAARQAPMLMIGPRAEKPASGGGFDTAFGMTMRLPLGGSRQAAVPAAEAGLASADARSNRELDVRQLELDFHEAVHLLGVNAEHLDLASEQAKLATRRAKMADMAYREGEFDLEELLRAQQTARDADRARERLTLTSHLLVAMYNQAVGDLP